MRQIKGTPVPINVVKESSSTFDPEFVAKKVTGKVITSEQLHDTVVKSCGITSYPKAAMTELESILKSKGVSVKPSL